MAILAVIIAVSALPAHAQGPFKKEVVATEAHVKPFPPVRIVGNLYTSAPAALERERAANIQ